MAVSMGGHQGGVMFGKLVDIAERYGYRQRHVAWNERGVRQGLPPDVVTLQVGEPADGFWYNIRRGVVPEFSVRTKGGVYEDAEAHQIADQYGIGPYAAQHRAGIVASKGREDARSMFNERVFNKRVPSKLIYTGWRETLVSWLKNRLIRENPETEELLGIHMYQDTLRRRSMIENIWYPLEEG